MPEHTETHTHLRASVAAFAEREGGLGRVRAARAQATGFDRATWRKLAALGWVGLMLPEDHGGAGLGVAEMAIVARELGRWLAPEPLTAAGVLAARAIAHGALSGTNAQRMLAIARGDVLPTVAWQETLGVIDVESTQTLATSDRDRVRLSGVKRFVAYGMGADGFVVSARSAAGVGLYWVARGCQGVSYLSQQCADATEHGTLSLDEVTIDRSDVIAEAGHGAAALARAIDEATVITGAELLGVGERALEVTLAYLRTREQFGRPIGSFQALQHRCVDLFIEKELCVSALGAALRRIELADARERAALASRVKARCADAALTICREAIQMHGALGFTDECDIGMYLKRALTLSAWLGNAHTHRRRYGALSQTGKGARLDVPGDRASAGRKSSQAPISAGRGVTDWNALSDDAFRAEVRGYYAQHFPAHLRNRIGYLSWEEQKDWYARLYAKGWAAPSWPREYGGMGLDPGKLLIFVEERLDSARGPDFGGIVMLGPVLMQFGTPEQKAHYLPRILSGEQLWAQGYSEPGSGSDLASLRTEAILDGDTFVVNGQKIWTTWALDCTHIFALVRTDKTAKKQSGISFLLIDRKTPGVTVRGIRNLAGEQAFCEVFFDNVRVPRENLVGEMNQGWTLSQALVGYERLLIGNPKHCLFALERLATVARAQGLFGDAGFLDRFSRLALDVEDLGATYARYCELVKRGEPIGADISMLKIWATETLQRITEQLVETANEHGASLGVVDFGGAEVDILLPFYIARPTTIGAGTSEIQRNIIARRVLGLPA